MLISLQFTLECVCVWWCVFVYLLLKCTIVQHSGDCVYLSLFSNAERKTEEETKNTKQIFEEFDRGNIKNRGNLGDKMEESREKQLLNDSSICHFI